MARQLLFALALASPSLALLDQYINRVDVVHVNVQHVGAAFPVVGDMIHAAVDEEEGTQACDAAVGIIDACASAGALDENASDEDAASCLCCNSAVPISTAYGVCAEYIYSSGSGAEATSAYELASEVFVMCSAAGSGLCGGGGGGGGSGAATRTAPPASDITAPAACTSMINVLESCDQQVGLETAAPSDIQSCLCGGGSFEDNASSCAAFARTAATEDYEIISALQSVCDEAAATATSRIAFTAVSSRSLGAAGSSPTGGATGAATGSSRSGASGTNSAGAAGATSRALAAPSGQVPGVLTWAANLATFFLSFFFLI